MVTSNFSCTVAGIIKNTSLSEQSGGKTDRSKGSLDPKVAKDRIQVLSYNFHSDGTRAPILH